MKRAMLRVESSGDSSNRLRPTCGVVQADDDDLVVDDDVEHPPGKADDVSASGHRVSSNSYACRVDQLTEFVRHGGDSRRQILWRAGFELNRLYTKQV